MKYTPRTHELKTKHDYQLTSTSLNLKVHHFQHYTNKNMGKCWVINKNNLQCRQNQTMQPAKQVMNKSVTN